MSSLEHSIIPLEEVQPTVSSQRRIQNRVAQRRFRERKAQKAKTAEHASHKHIQSRRTTADFSTEQLPNHSSSNFSGLWESSIAGHDMPLSFTPSESSNIPSSAPIGVKRTTSWDARSPDATNLPSIAPLFDIDGGSLPAEPFLDTWESDQTQHNLPWVQSIRSRQTRTDYLTPPPSNYNSPDFVSGCTNIPDTNAPSIKAGLERSQTPRRASQTATSLRLWNNAFDDTAYEGTTPSQSTPLLHVAARSRNRAVINVLLRRGVATINERDAEGRTALHVAAELGDEALVGLLLSKKANTQIKDLHGRLALYYAVEKGHCEVVEMLLDSEEI